MRGRLGFDADDDDVEYYRRATVTLGKMEWPSEGAFRAFAQCWRLRKRPGLESIPALTFGR
jgi:hypothetical protein